MPKFNNGPPRHDRSATVPKLPETEMTMDSKCHAQRALDNPEYIDFEIPDGGPMPTDTVYQ